MTMANAQSKRERLLLEAPRSSLVRCSRELHQIDWDTDQPRFHAHRLTDLRFLTAIATPCRCAKILTYFSSRPLSRVPADFPRHDGTYYPPLPLYTAYRQYLLRRRAQGHGQYLSPTQLVASLQERLYRRAVERYFAPETEALQTRGLHACISAERNPATDALRPVVRSLHPTRAMDRPLASYSDHWWALDREAIRVTATALRKNASPSPFWGTPGGRCRVCHRQCRPDPLAHTQEKEPNGHLATVMNLLSGVLTPAYLASEQAHRTPA